MRISRILVGLLCNLLLTLSLSADDHNVQFDKYSDFSMLKTFALNEGKISSPKPELNNSLIVQNVGDAIRTQLLQKGLKETETSNYADITVDYRISSIDYAAQRGGPPSYSEGTLVVDIMNRKLGILVWRGVYRDDERNVFKLIRKLPEDVRRLFSEYPPRQASTIPPRPLGQARPFLQISPPEAASAVLALIESTRKDIAYVGPNTHPGLNVRFNNLERVAKTVVEDDGTRPAATEDKTDRFRKALNETAEFVLRLAGDSRESPDARQKSVELDSKLRALSNF